MAAGSRLPWWANLLVGVTCVLLGAVLTLRPFSSLTVLLIMVVVGLVVTGVGELLSARPRPRLGHRPRWRLTRGLIYLAAAAAVMVWPGPTIKILAVTVGVVLIVGGALDLLEARTLRGLPRWNSVTAGVASIGFGGLALGWPDVTVLVIAVLFGAWTVVFGVRQVVASLRRRRRTSTSDGSVAVPLVRPGWRQLAGNLLAVGVASVLIMVSIGLHRAAPSPDAFYDPPAMVPETPGALLRSEPFTRAVPAGATAWRILYTTTRDDQQPAVASAIVVAPTAPATTPRPVIAWAHGTTGATPACAPSLLANPFEAGALFVLDQVITQGWVLVATDYVGLGTAGPHPYLIGQGEARSVLDAVRAAHQLDTVKLATDTVVWGHSQGGNAALWTGIIAPTYAPDVTIDGVAALAPATNLPALITNLATVTGGTLFASFVINSYAAIYPDVHRDDYVRPGARIIVDESATHCLGSDPGVLVSILESLFLDKPIWTANPDRGALAARLRENVPSGPIAAPLLIAQGDADTLVIPAAQTQYVRQRCSAGQQLDYRTYAGRDHVPLVQPDSPLIPELFAWTRDRLAGRASANTCR